MTNATFVTNWVLDTVKKEYAQDIALVVSHTTLRIDDSEKAIGYFVPVTERGYQFGRTFILNGEGFDIWGIGWERLEKFANLEEYNITCLADGEILYARSPEDARRFKDLQKRQLEYLSNPSVMRKNALTAYEQAKKIYLEMLFAQDSDVKMGAGYVLDYLAQAIAFSNLRYFKKAQTEQIQELSTMEKVPQGFPDLYCRIILEPDQEKQKSLCYESINLVKDFLQSLVPPHETMVKQDLDFQMLADWYGELSYTWLRIRYYAEQNDAVKVYMWGIMLQNELNHICEAYGLQKMQLMDAYRADQLLKFAEHANQLENMIQSMIIREGGTIHTYTSTEDFLYEI
ncbi:MAG TPA: hypothetical protein H9671_06495 [Firmicutes bacterium]|nr:hypothetical protein [Bacillota bacterium]